MNKENDLFSEAVKNKLVNYTFPVDEDSWDTIAQRLNPVPRKKTKLRWISAIAVAASITLILFLLLPINKKIHNHETADQLSNDEETIIQIVSEKENFQSVIRQNVGLSESFRKSQPRKQMANNELAIEVISDEESAEENHAFTTKEDVTASENYHSPASYFNLEKEEKIPATIKHKKSNSLRFSLGSGGTLLAQNSLEMIQNQANYVARSSNIEFSYFRSAAVEINEPRTIDIIMSENFTDVVHHLPLSFGVTVKKEIDQTFAIESGVVYSYLSTSFSRESYPASKADLQLHYIGIPLNLHTHLIGNRFSKWEVYLSTGGMIEKGILSHFTQKTYYDNIDSAVKTVTLDEKINGLQWSVNVSPGIDYKVLKNYSIYLEPKLSYYFDNDQPVSARTKHPVVIGINAGVRYTW